MNWMSWLRDRCVDLTERVAAGSDRRPGQRPEVDRHPRGRVPGSGSEPTVMLPAAGEGAE